LIFAAALVGVLVTAAGSQAATPSGGRYIVNPQVSGPQAVQPGAQDTFGCQSRPFSTGTSARCYTPQQLWQAYGFTGLLASGDTGTGKTIVIIDAFGSPTVASDLHDFDRDMGLPDTTLNVIPVGNVPTFDINDNNMVGWAEETSLDVQWAHAIAPGATIDLVEAQSNNDADILAATKFAIDNKLGDVISQSFGEAEQCVSPASVLPAENALFAKATSEGMTLFASSGDSGASQPNCDNTGAVESASTPASDPNVTGVGGTSLSLTDDPTGTATVPSGSRISETAWTEFKFGCNPPALDFPFDVNCSGGGFSSLYRMPAWQAPLVKGSGPSGPPARGVPDVAYNAGSNGGVLVHLGFLLPLFGFGQDDPVYFIIGGTSAGSPQWAGLAADADQMAGHDLGNINPNLYRLAQNQKTYGADLFDITQGNNDVAELGPAGFNAGTGWDAVTGLGSPNAANLIPALAANAH
jgi:subtilase family serine protease